MKISNAKRSQHLKNKKNYSKPLKKKQQPAVASKTADKNATASKKVFGRPSIDHARKKNKKKTDARSQLPVPQVNNGAPTEEEEEEVFGDMLDMMDDEDRAQIEGFRSAQKRKHDDDDEETAASKEHEKQFAHNRNVEASRNKRTVDLLPIKTKSGDVITRSTEVDIVDDVQPDDDLGDESDDEDREEEIIDSDDDIINDKAVRIAFFFFGSSNFRHSKTIDDHLN